jgi:hypothetical protein
MAAPTVPFPRKMESLRMLKAFIVSFAHVLVARIFVCPDCFKGEAQMNNDAERLAEWVSIEVAHAHGCPCCTDAVAGCFDCGIALCDAHAEDCAVCNETFCATCLALHNRDQHQKKPATAPDRKRKSV